MQVVAIGKPFNPPGPHSGLLKQGFPDRLLGAALV
jgi:hypothetical protein